MNTNDNRNNPEAGFLYQTGRRRDSARRLPLRQTGLSFGRDLSPGWQRKYAQRFDEGESDGSITMDGNGSEAGQRD
jgi:hypothetical protein